MGTIIRIEFIFKKVGFVKIVYTVVLRNCRLLHVHESH